MILIDANILLYAYHPRSENHEACKKWVEDALSGVIPIRLAWMTILAFLRISTNHRVFEQPLGMIEARAIVSEWLAARPVAVLEPGERYWEILGSLLEAEQVTGPLVMDASLAALAIEHGATLCTSDRDFARFTDLRTANPVAG